MSRFIAFYRCHGCGEIIGGFVSNTMLLVDDPTGKYWIINPREIKTKGE